MELAFPVIGDLPLNQIDSALVLKVLSPILKRTHETGTRLRGRIERVFEWARPLGLFTGDNPASREVLQDHLPKAEVNHHAAMPYAMVPEFMATLRSKDSLSARALEFTILTAVRTNEAIGARWSEIDLEAKVWTIPAARMKADRDHRVPFSARAVAILEGLSRHSDFIFANGKPLSNMNAPTAARHRWEWLHRPRSRSAFSDWARQDRGPTRLQSAWLTRSKTHQGAYRAMRSTRESPMRSWGDCAQGGASLATTRRLWLLCLGGTSRV